MLDVLTVVRQPYREEPFSVALPDRTYIKAGSIDGFVRVLPEDEDFSTFVDFKNTGETRIAGGTHVAAIKDIRPMDSISRSDDQTIRNLTKLLITGDFLDFVARSEDVDPKVKIFYVLTNPEMALFMCKHWGFSLLGESGDQKVVAANKIEIHSSYPHLSNFPYLVPSRASAQG